MLTMWHSALLQTHSASIIEQPRSYKHMQA